MLNCTESKIRNTNNFWFYFFHYGNWDNSFTLEWMVMMMMILSKYYYLIGIFISSSLFLKHSRKRKHWKWLNNSLPAKTPDSQRVFNIFSVWIIRNDFNETGNFLLLFCVFFFHFFGARCFHFFWPHFLVALWQQQSFKPKIVVCESLFILFLFRNSEQHFFSLFYLFPTKITSLKSSSCFLLHCAVSLSGAFYVIIIIVVQFWFLKAFDTNLPSLLCTRITKKIRFFFWFRIAF